MKNFNFPDRAKVKWDQTVWKGHLDKMFIVGKLLILTGKENGDRPDMRGGLIEGWDAGSGRKIWRKTFPGGSTDNAPVAFLFQGFLVVQAIEDSRSSFLLFFDPSNGDIKKEIPVPTAFPLNFYYHENKFYLLSNQEIFEFDETLTHVNLVCRLSFIRENPFVYRNGIIYTVSTDRFTIVGVNPLTGNIEWNLKLDRDITSLIPFDKGLIARCNFLFLYYINIEHKNSNLFLSKSIKCQTVRSPDSQTQRFYSKITEPVVCGDLLVWECDDLDLKVVNLKDFQELHFKEFAPESDSFFINENGKLYYFERDHLARLDLNSMQKVTSEKVSLPNQKRGGCRFCPDSIIMTEFGVYVMDTFSVVCFT